MTEFGNKLNNHNDLLLKSLLKDVSVRAITKKRQNGMYSDFENSRDTMDNNTPTSPQNNEIYQRINSLLDSDRDQHSTPDCDSMTSISDLLGLNYPRGSLVDLPRSPVGFGRRKFETSTPFSSHCHYGSEFNIASPIRNFQKSFDNGYHSLPSSPMPPRRQQSLTKYSDCGSPSTDNSILTNSTRSLSPPESNTIPDNSLSELMNSLSMQSNYHPLLAGTDQELANQLAYNAMNPMNPIQVQQSTLKLIQQQQQHLQASLLSLMKQQSLHESAGLDKSWSNFLTGNATSAVGDGNGNSLERAARFHRSAAAVHDAMYTWSGVLPTRNEKDAIYSCKVFLGGVPWDLSEQTLQDVLRVFGPIRVEWPGKEKQVNPPKGHVYIIFDTEKQVRALLSSCCKDYANGGSWYYKISSRRMKSKEVQVIPWSISDCNYAKTPCQKLDPQKTVFVGALHGVITAEGLAKIMNDLFDGVLYVGIDTDKFKYPIGSARVTFSNTRSFMKAIRAGFIEIKTAKFCKKIQVDPYLEDSLCSSCSVQQGPYFCRELVCFRYFCLTCWNYQHDVDSMKHHSPLMRTSRNSQIHGFGNVSNANMRFDN